MERDESTSREPERHYPGNRKHPPSTHNPMLLILVSEFWLPAPSVLQSSFMFRGLEHTAIASPDPARLAEWYVQKLDFRINYTYDGNYFVRASDGSMLEIIPSQGERAPQQMKDPGIRHLAVSVDNFDAALGELRNRGVQFLTEPFANQGNRLVFFSDGDGNILHLIQRERPLP
jgi:glyoxylase I family protein